MVVGVFCEGASEPDDELSFPLVVPQAGKVRTITTAIIIAAIFFNIVATSLSVVLLELTTCDCLWPYKHSVKIS